MSGKAPEHPDAQKQPGSDSDEDEVFFDARFPPEEEANLLAQSNELKSEANTLFASSRYSEAITTYERALSCCPNYLDYEIAVLKSNISACHLKLGGWQAAVDAANASLACLDRVLPRPNRETENQATTPKRAGGVKGGEADVVELPAGDADDEKAELKKLAESDARKEDVTRIRAKSLMRRGRGKMELGGWANLQGAEEDYKQLVQMHALPPRDERMVREKLRELPARINVAKEKEIGDMMGKLKDLGNGILKPFGLSTDNFKFVQDEKTGGYSMSFGQ